MVGEISGVFRKSPRRDMNQEGAIPSLEGPVVDWGRDALRKKSRAFLVVTVHTIMQLCILAIKQGEPSGMF